MKAKRPRYQQGSIRKLERAIGYVWEVRYSEKVGGKRHQRTQIYNGAQYRTEKDVRKAMEMTISQINSGTAGEKTDAKFGVITKLYRTEHLPTLDHSTQLRNAGVLTNYIEKEFGQTPLREMRPLVFNKWLQALKLSPSSKAIIRSVTSICFRLAALNEFIPPMGANPMLLIKIKGVSKRKKKITEITVENFKRLFAKLPEPLNIIVLLAGAYGLRISEVLALKWEDIDAKAAMLSVVRKFTAGKLGETKTISSEAPLPMSKSIYEVLMVYKPKTNGSEWVFPSSRTGGPRSGGMLLQKGLRPIAEELGMGKIGFHSLRHACRSWLTSEGVAVGTQKDLLRHSDIGTTMNVYGSSVSEDMRKAHENHVGELLG